MHFGTKNILKSNCNHTFKMIFRLGLRVGHYSPDLHQISLYLKSLPRPPPPNPPPPPSPPPLHPQKNPF